MQRFKDYNVVSMHMVDTRNNLHNENNRTSKVEYLRNGKFWNKCIRVLLHSKFAILSKTSIRSWTSHWKKKKLVCISPLRIHLSRNHYCHIVYFFKSYNFRCQHFRVLLRITKMFRYFKVREHIVQCTYNIEI